MRQLLPTFLLIACVAPGAAAAQRAVPRVDDDFRDEVRIPRLMDRLRDEMWAYRQELNFFARDPQYPRLVDLRYALRGQAIRVAELEDRGRGARRLQRDVAAEMKRTADELKRLTSRLEDRTDTAPARGVRRRGDVLKDRADRIESMIDRLARLTRDD